MDSVCNIADGGDSDLTMRRSAATNVGRFRKQRPRGSTTGTRDEPCFGAVSWLLLQVTAEV